MYRCTWNLPLAHVLVLFPLLQAAAHVHRFLSLDENLLREPGPDPKKADSFASSMHVLQQASSDLQQVIIEGFNKAVLSRDHNNIERCASGRLWH